VLTLTVLSEDWKSELARLLKCTRTHLIISSPYITDEGTNFVLENLSRQAITKGHVRILTDLSPGNICQGSTDPSALKSLSDALSDFCLLHLPKLHAKVYVGDENCAIVTSANLTAGGIHRNYEYGVKISHKRAVGEIAQDITAYSELGAMVTAANLDKYCQIASRLRKTYRKQQRTITKAAQKEFQLQILTVEDELVRLRLSGGAMHTVFAKTILYLLQRYGPLRTIKLHPKVESIHPDLCDNTVDRVIDGKRFGKKWKHAVRTAQQQLKKNGQIRLVGDRWMLT